VLNSENNCPEGLFIIAKIYWKLSYWTRAKLREVNPIQCSGYQSSLYEAEDEI